MAKWDDHDDDFLAPGSGSGLASIFGVSSAMDSASTNPSLTYQAPKQPKKNKGGGGQGEAAQVLVAAAADTQKHVDGRYVPQGKLGCAVLAQHTTCNYQLLLYVSNQKHLATVKIDASFNYTVQANNYASLYDDQRQAWSLHFGSVDDAAKIAKQIALCKVNAVGPAFSQLLQQDLVLGEGPAVERGDSVDVKYTGYLFENNGIGKVFDTNASSDKSFRFKLGKGKVIKGWDEGTVGMAKGGKRLLVIPPALGYGSQGVSGRIPANACLVFEVELRKVKLSRDRDIEQPAPVATPPKMDTPPEDRRQDTVRQRTKSIEETMSSDGDGGGANRSEILSRISKMGQSMLPVAPSTESAEGSVESQPQPAVVAPAAPVQTPPQQQPTPPAAVPVPAAAAAPAPAPAFSQAGYPMQQQPMGFPSHAAFPSQSSFGPQQPPMMGSQLAVYHPPSHYLGGQPFQQPGYLGQQPGYGQPFYQTPPAPPPPAPAPPKEDSTNTTLLSETRHQTTEVRMELTKLTSKIEDISGKLDKMREEGGGGGGMALTSRGPTPSMEASVLLHNIQRIIQENEHLKRDVFEKSARIETQNLKIAELLERNQRFVEQSNNMLEQRSDAFKNTAANSQAKVLQLEQEKVGLTTEYAQTTAQLSSLQLEIGNLHKSENEMKQHLATAVAQVQRSAQDLTILTQKYEELQSRADSTSAELKEEKSEGKRLKGDLHRIHEELSDTKSERESAEKSLADLKRKIIAKKKQWEEEMEEMKQSHEAEISQLKDKHRREKTSSNASVTDQLTQQERDLEEQWQAKCARQVSQTEDKWRRKYRNLEEEMEGMKEMLSDSCSRLEAIRQQDTVSQLHSAQQELEDVKMTVQQLRRQLAESQSAEKKVQGAGLENINSLEKEKASLLRELEEAGTVIARLRASEETLTNKMKEAGTGGISPEEVQGKVKSIMNQAYQTLASAFKAKEQFQSKEILEILIRAIRDITLKALQQAKSQEEEEEEEEEDEEEDDEEEDDEDEEDEEDEDEEEDQKTDEDEEEKDDVPAAVTQTTEEVDKDPPQPVTTGSRLIGRHQSPPPLPDDEEDEEEAEVDEEKEQPPLVQAPSPDPPSPEQSPSPSPEQSPSPPPVERSPSPPPVTRSPSPPPVERSPSPPPIERSTSPPPVERSPSPPPVERSPSPPPVERSPSPPPVERSPSPPVERSPSPPPVERSPSPIEKSPTPPPKAQPKSSSKRSGGLFGSDDDDDDDLFSTPVQPPTKSSSSTTKQPTSTKKPIDDSVFGDTSDLGLGNEDNLFASPKKQEVEEKTSKKPVPNPLFSDDDDELDWLN